MEIQAVQRWTALDTTTRAQSTQENQAASGAQNGAKPSGGVGGKPPAGGAAPSGGTQKSSSSSDSTSSNKVYDKKDTNKDGTVSYAEEMAYAVNHPDESDETRSTDSNQSSYDQSGKAQKQSSGFSSLIDILA
jgi:hypothetical protein